MFVATTVFTNAQASKVYDFEAVNAEGQTLYYKILSSESGTCELAGETYLYNLTDVVVPEYVTYRQKQFQVIRIGDNAFNSCPLAHITLPNSITEIGVCSFAYTLMKSVELPSGIRRIGKGAFLHSMLESMNWPESVAVIEENTFQLSKLQHIKIPATVTKIEDDAFLSCSSLTEADFQSLHHLISITYGNSYSNPLNYTGRLVIDGQEVVDLEIPEDVEMLPYFIFSGCSNLKTVTLPENLSRIGQWAFSGCSGLTNVDYASIEQMCSIDYYGIEANPLSQSHHFTVKGQEVESLVIPEGVKKIGNYAFFGSESIKSVVTPNSVETIGCHAFKDCRNMKSLTLGNGIMEIGNECFAGCKLREIEILAETPPAIGMSTFSGQSQYHTTLYVPVGASDSYAYDDTYWYLFNTIHENAVKEQELSSSQVYMLKNSESRSFLVYDKVNDGVRFVELDTDVDLNEASHSWQLIKEGGNTYIYNLGACQYLRIEGESISVTPEKTPVDVNDGTMGICLGGEQDWLFVLNNRLSVHETGIERVTEDDYQNADVRILDILGRECRQSSSAKGIHIVRNTDGSTQKVLVR